MLLGKKQKCRLILCHAMPFGVERGRIRQCLLTNVTHARVQTVRHVRRQGQGQRCFGQNVSFKYRRYDTNQPQK